MKTSKTIKDTPAEGHALLERHTSSFARTKNGAWIGNGGTTETFEIPLSVLNSPAGCGWLNPGRCGDVFLKLPDGSFISVSGANDPIRTSGFGELGSILVGDQEKLVTAPHPLLPNLVANYYRVEYYPDEIITAFKTTHNWQISFLNAAGDVVDTSKTGPFKVTRSFAEYVAKTGLFVREATGAVSFKLEEI